MTATTRTPARWRWPQTLVVLATLLAAGLRIWHLNIVPPQAWYDEIWFALRARELLQTGALVAHYGISDTAGNAGLVYLTALARALGIDSMVAARVVSALAGILTPPLTYACLSHLLRRAFPSQARLMAAVSALILAYLPVMVIAGRVGMEPALAPPVALFAAWQVSLGLRRGSWQHWALAGLVAGLAQYNGPHARFVLPLIACVILEGIIRRGGSQTRPRKAGIWIGIAILLGIGLLVNIPLIITFAQHPDWFWGRAETVSAGVSLPQNILLVLGAFDIAGDLNARQNLPGQPMLDGLLGIGFLAGTIWAIWRCGRSDLARLLLVWLALMLIPSALTAEAPNFGRMIGVTPPAAALAVIGGDAILGWLSHQAALRQIASLAPAALIGMSLAWSLYVVFGLWAHSPDLAAAFNTDSVAAARDLVRRAQNGEAVYVERLPEMLDEPAFTYAFAGTSIRRADFRQCVPLFPDTARPAAYLFIPEGGGSGAEFLKNYRGLDWKKMQILWGRQGDLAEGLGGVPERPSLARFAPGIDLVEAQRLPRGAVSAGSSITLRLFWRIEDTIRESLTAFVHVQRADALYQPPSVQDDRQPCGDVYPSTAWRRGEVIAYTVTLSLPGDLAAGEYVIVVGWYDRSTSLRALLIDAAESLPGERAVIDHLSVLPAQR